MVTAYDDVDTAVKAMRPGVYHYLSKPLRGDAVVAVVERAIDILPAAARVLGTNYTILHVKLNAYGLRGRKEPTNALVQENGRG
jgi:FixJ family two-component response regulator